MIVRKKLIALLQKQVAAQKGKAGVQVKEHLQRDIERLDGGLSPVSIDRYLPILYEPQTILDYFDGQAMTFLCEPVSCRENFANAMAQHHEDIKMLLEEGVLFKGCSVYYDDFTELCRKLCRHQGVLMDTFTRSLNEVPLKELVQITASQLSTWSGEYAILKDDVEDYMKTGFCCVVFAGTPRGAQALADDLRQDFSADLVQDVPAITPGKIYVLEGTLSAGMEYPQLKLAIISHAKTGVSRTRAPKQKKGGHIKNLSDLNVGDYVVHVSHGIGIFEGIVKREIHGVVKDYIKIRYAGTDMLFVPVTQMDLVTKYIGGKEEGIVKLNKLNSAEWAKTRARVKKAVKDMADELIKLYAKREASKGYAFGQDTDWQNDFERRFPYDETDDQLRCIQEIKADMERPVPMDRLLCGDVGLRQDRGCHARSLQVRDGRQAVRRPGADHHPGLAALPDLPQPDGGIPGQGGYSSPAFAPRAQQERGAGRSCAAARSTSSSAPTGWCRRTSNSRTWGWCIIDEEQRFGVQAQGDLQGDAQQRRRARPSSATPIPRTLNMAMSGIRDMSTIEEAPQDRQPVQTYVMEHDWGILTQAMNKELRRGGQVLLSAQPGGHHRQLRGHHPEARSPTRRWWSPTAR